MRAYLNCNKLFFTSIPVGEYQEGVVNHSASCIAVLTVSADLSSSS